jgi:phosphoglycolate phosphatase-like HAD superfamily hydrolase
MDSVGVDGEGVLYVGDTDIDMATAVAASVKGVGMTTGNFDRSGLIEAGAWTVLDDLAELCPLVGLPFPCGARL